MKISGRASCAALPYVSEKSGKAYIQFHDLDIGGQFTIVVDGSMELKPGQMVTFEDVTVQPSQYNGKLSLNYISGNIKKA